MDTVEKSKLSMSPIQLLRFDYGVNKNYDIEKFKKGIRIEPIFKTGITINKLERTAEAVLNVKIFKKNDTNFPIWLEATNKASFAWDETLDEKAETLIYSNAPAHLLSYIRPLVSQITSMSELPTLTIPLMNFSRNRPTKKKKTT